MQLNYFREERVRLLHIFFLRENEAADLFSLINDWFDIMNSYVKENYDVILKSSVFISNCRKIY